MNSIEVKCIVKEGAALPIYKTLGAAGADVCALIEKPVVIQPGKRGIVPTGLFFEIPEGYEIQVRPRSGLAAKNGVMVLNTPGTIDSDYRGEIIVALINLGQDAFELNNQGSCRGYRIMVCFINRFGELRKCECTYSTTGETAKVAEAIWNNEEQDTAAQHQIDKMLDTTAQNKAGKELDATARARAEKKQKIGDESKNTSAVEPKEGPSLWDVLIPTGTFFLGFLTCKYGKTAVKAAKTIIALI